MPRRTELREPSAPSTEPVMVSIEPSTTPGVSPREPPFSSRSPLPAATAGREPLVSPRESEIPLAMVPAEPPMLAEPPAWVEP